jgi:selenocysteine lyase/cysteine desulfurase
VIRTRSVPGRGACQNDTVSDLETFIASFDEEPGYLDWAAFGPLSPAVRAEMLADAELLGTGRPSSIGLVASHQDVAREHLAALLDASIDEVVLQPSTTIGLLHAFSGLSGSVVVSTGEFPSLTMTAERAAQARGTLSVQWLEPPDGFVSPDAVAEALTDETTAVAVSLVDFRSGYLADLGALRDTIGDRLLIVDATQGFGVVDADWAAADVVCGNGFKWLRAGRGTGWARFGARAVERIAPVLSGFAGTGGDLPVDVLPAPAASAQAFQLSGTDPLAAGRLASALGEIAAAGVAGIAGVLSERAEEVAFYADRYGVPVVTPRDRARRAGIVALAPEPADVGPLGAALANHGVAFTGRSGLIRLSPHVGTGEDTMQLLGDALAAFSSARVR